MSYRVARDRSRSLGSPACSRFWSASGSTAGDQDALEDVIERCATAKALVVARDERDRGPRAILNYGHTAAHALEAASRFRISHGRAVAFGMRVAANMALDLGLCSDRLVAAQDELLMTYGPRDEHPRLSPDRMT